MNPLKPPSAEECVEFGCWRGRVCPGAPAGVHLAVRRPAVCDWCGGRLRIEHRYWHAVNPLSVLIGEEP